MLNPDLIKAFAITLLFSIIFGLYLFFVGIPLTKASNLTIQATELAQEGLYREAIEKLEEANRIQKTAERNARIEDYRKNL